MTNEEYFEDSIKKIARIVYSGHMRHQESDDHNYETYYYCKYCGIGLHPSTRKCRHIKYFKHKIDCPVLIAKDFLRGELEE